MKLIRVIAMNTDHGFHGNPIEMTRVELYLDEDVITPEVVAIAKQLQEERLHSYAKSMPHRYWIEPKCTWKP